MTTVYDIVWMLSYCDMKMLSDYVTPNKERRRVEREGGVRRLGPIRRQKLPCYYSSVVACNILYVYSMILGVNKEGAEDGGY